MSVRPYGTWPSPLGFDAVAQEPASRFALLDVGDGRVRWTESRAAEGGRAVVAAWQDGRLVDVTPAGTNARTRVHEYGGGAVWAHGDTVFFSEFADGRVYRLDPGGEPRPVTPEPSRPHALRYADGAVAPDGRTVVCVRERHEGGEVVNDLVAFPADGSAEPRVVASGHDFFAAPRISPDGRSLAWLAWDHPRMPWDGTELRLAALAADGTPSGERVVAGGPGESILQPRWSPDGMLHLVSDRNGWWNLHRLEPDGSLRALTALEDGEIGYPAWVFGMQGYAFLDDGRIACVVTRDARDSLELLDPGSGRLENLGLEWTFFTPTCLGAGDGRVVFAAASPTRPTALVSHDLASGEQTTIRRSLELQLDPAGISVPRAIEFPTLDGEGVAHAFFYPPASAEFAGPPGERPPLRVVCHGGPTGHSAPGFEPEYQFFTSRGIGVVDVNYRGSSGFGRAYRRLLDGRWGEIDWQDCVAAARHLAATGEADPDRTWVEGGSAGGYVVLCALTFDPHAFAAGVSLFGVADAEALARDTHKFESRYLDTMIGPYPECADLYRERSPVHFAERLARPLLLLQGLDDEVVPPSQAEMMADVLDRKGIPHAYIAFEGEGHGFRKEENIRRTLEATLGFVGRVFGFEPADEFEPLEIAHL
ncbi:MAG TPA: S9 family peptidase [Gaiellaceae bacterium]|nr:S9 family peptidase [Gaiellaceae bacterium]